MINAHFNAHKNPENAQLKAHYPILKVCNILTVFLSSMFNTPKHLNLGAGGMPSGILDNTLDEGYRTPLPNKITQTTSLYLPLIRQGGARKVHA
jgi:hypothetical protein